MGILVMSDNSIIIRFPPRENFVLVGGPNGVGKTTLWHGLENPGIEYIDQDDIKINLEKQFGHEVNKLVASKYAASQMLTLFKKRVSFAWETTLDAKKPLSILSNPKAYNYNVSMIYVAPLSVDDCIKNVRKRVENNGHDVPEDTIRIRYEKSIGNFCKIYQYVNNWYLYLSDDNDDKAHKLVAWSAASNIKLVNPELVQRLPQQLRDIFAGICH